MMNCDDLEFLEDVEEDTRERLTADLREALCDVLDPHLTLFGSRMAGSEAILLAAERGRRERAKGGNGLDRGLPWVVEEDPNDLMDMQDVGREGRVMSQAMRVCKEALDDAYLEVREVLDRVVQDVGTSRPEVVDDASG